jgi:NACalpha-BTF3-like transcription factor
MFAQNQNEKDVKKTSYENVMKSVKPWILPLILVGTLMFIFSTRENLQDTAGVQGPPYGKTPAAAQNIINIMTPELLKSLKRRMGVTSTNLTDAEKVRLVHGDGTNNSPISQVMSNFYWQVYKTSTSTITIAQVNTFLNNQDDSWVDANTADLREFLKRYFLQGQESGTQSGYGDILNSVLGATAAAAAAKPKETKKEDKKETKTEDTKTDVTQRLITIAAIGLAAFSILAALIVFLLPSRV